MLKKNEFEQTSLPYELNSLEPIIFFKSLYYHYEFIHRHYRNKLNSLIKENELQGKFSLEELLNKSDLPSNLQTEINFYGGGLINHNFFFQNLKDYQSEKKENFAEISPRLKEDIEKEFSSLSNFRQTVIEKANSINGSGWIWLVKKNKQLKVITTFNNDYPLTHGYQPLMTIDLWEHSYYLDYGYQRKEYITKVLDKLINWKLISENYENLLVVEEKNQIK